MRTIATAATLALLLGLSSPASATESSTALQPPQAEEIPAAKEPPTDTRWYGYQTLLADAASTALLIGAAKSETPTLAALGLGTYLIAGPVIHLANGRPKAAGTSLALRLSLPLAGAALGVGLGAATVGTGGWAGLVVLFVGAIGGIAGAGVASIIDATTLAREKVPRNSGFTMGVVPTRGGLTVGAAGTF